MEFYLASNSDGPPPVKSLDVSAAGTSQEFTVAGSKPTSTGDWVLNLFTFTANASTTTLFFQSTAVSGAGFNAYGAALDNVSISVVPIPTALPLFGASLAVLGFIGWRRKRRLA